MHVDSKRQEDIASLQYATASRNARNGVGRCVVFAMRFASLADLCTTIVLVVIEGVGVYRFLNMIGYLRYFTAMLLVAYAVKIVVQRARSLAAIAVAVSLTVLFIFQAVIYPVY